MGILAGVGDESLLQLINALSIALKRRGSFAGSHHRAEQAAAGGVLDHAAADSGRATKLVGQAEQLLQPIEHVRFKFCASRRCGPEHSLDT